jgi:hypothetical protein
MGVMRDVDYDRHAADGQDIEGRRPAINGGAAGGWLNRMMSVDAGMTAKPPNSWEQGKHGDPARSGATLRWAPRGQRSLICRRKCAACLN